MDDGLLALASNPTWDLLKAMMRSGGGWMQGTDLRTSLLRPPHLGPDAMFWPWDDRGRSALPPPPSAPSASRISPPGEALLGLQPRTRFETLTYWSTEVILDGNGEARVNVPYNDALTRWRIVAVVLDGTEHFGTGEATVQASQDVQVFSGLPPRVRSGDSIRGEMTVRNAGKLPVGLQLHVKGSAERLVSGLPTLRRQIGLAPGESRIVAWDYKVPAGIDRIRWTVAALAPRGVVADSLAVEQVVTPAVPVTTRHATLVQVAPVVKLPVTMPPEAEAGRGGVRVALQASLVEAALSGVRRWMAAYPYPCLEQQVSMLAVSGDVQAWAQLMSKLDTYLDHKGLARYFPGSRAGSPMLTAYLLDVAQARAWVVPAARRSAMLTGLKTALAEKGSDGDWMPDPSQAVAPPPGGANLR